MSLMKINKADASGVVFFAILLLSCGAPPPSPTAAVVTTPSPLPEQAPASEPTPSTDEAPMPEDEDADVPAQPLPRDENAMPPLVFPNLVPYWDFDARRFTEDPADIALREKSVADLKRRYAEVLRRPTLRVVSVSSGLAVLEYRIPKFGGPDWNLDQFGRLVMTDVFPSPGRYRVEITWQENPPKQEQVETTVERGDIAVEVYILITDSSLSASPRPRQKRMIDQFDVVRIAPSPSSVRLNRAWTPDSTSDPRYKILNNGPHDIAGVGWLGRFDGKIEHLEEGGWYPTWRGGCHISGVAGADAAPPGGFAISTECYPERARSFVPGRYRFVVRYGIPDTYGWVETTHGVPADFTPRSFTHYQLDDVFVVRDI